MSYKVSTYKFHNNKAVPGSILVADDGQMKWLIPPSKEKREEYAKWCEDNCQGRFTVSTVGIYVFDLKDDALMFKLTFAEDLCH